MWRRSSENEGFRVSSPLWLFGVAALVVGLIVLGDGVARLVQLQEEIPGNLVPWFRARFNEDPARGYHLVVNVVFSVVGVAVGLVLAIFGLANLRPMRGTSAGAPALSSTGEVAHAIREGEMPSFRPIRSLGSYLFQGISGGRLAFLPEAARGVFLENVRFLRTAVVLISIVVVVFYFKSYVFSAVDPPPSLPSGSSLLAIICSILAVKLVANALLTPFSAPSLRGASEGQTVTNAGDPATAHWRLKEAAQGLAPPGGSARVWEQSLDLSGGGIADRGTAKGHLLVETGIESASPPKPYAALLLLAAGMVLLPLGLLQLIHLDVARPLFDTRDAFLRQTLPVALTDTAIFLLCAFYGGQFLRQARTLAARVRYRSVTYLIEMSGAYGRAALHVGKAVDDSIESETVAVGSDLSISYHAADLLTEGGQADSPRYAVALAPPERVEMAFDSFRREIEEFAARGIEIRGPAAVSPELVRIAQLNARMWSGRMAATRGSEPEEVEAGEAAPLWLTRAGETTPASRQGRCPACGAEIESEANFCPSCGQGLRQADSSEAPRAGGAGD